MYKNHASSLISESFLYIKGILLCVHIMFANFIWMIVTCNVFFPLKNSNINVYILLDISLT